MSRGIKAKNTINLVYEKSFRNVLHFLAAIFFIGSLLCNFSLSQARTIWKIGLENNSSGEFGLPPLDQFNIIYQANKNGESEGIWKAFPQYLCPPGLDLRPEDINVTCRYLQDYKCPILSISVRSDTDCTQRLGLLKGGNEILLQNDKDLVRFFFSVIKFPLGYVEKGLCVGNDIILKNKSVSGKEAIFFDYLELDDQDEDRDWSLNSEEYDGDTDGDGKEDRDDPDTASILIQDYDQTIRKRIILDIQEKENLIPFFQKLALLNQNSSEYPSELPKDISFPYGLFMAKIKIQGEEEKIPLRVIFPEKLHPFAQFYILHKAGELKDLPIEILNGNSIVIYLEAGKENNEAQVTQREKDTNDYELINITCGLGYPLGTNNEMEGDVPGYPLEIKNELGGNGCFISSVYCYFLTFTQITPLFYLLLIFFLILYLRGSLFTKANFRQAKDNFFNIFGIPQITTYPIKQKSQKQKNRIIREGWKG